MRDPRTVGRIVVLVLIGSGCYRSAMDAQEEPAIGGAGSGGAGGTVAATTSTKITSGAGGIVGYGGGPNVREKLLRRGVDKLKSKRLVILMMTARDLYDHAEGWQAVEK